MAIVTIIIVLWKFLLLTGVIKVVVIPNSKINEQLSIWKLRIDEITHIPYIGISHSSEWDRGFDNEECNQEIIKKFYSDMREMVGFLKDFSNETKVTKCIIGKFHRYRWFENWSDIEQIDIYIELINFLSQNRIDKGSKKGIEIGINEHWDVISKIIEGGFRYISCASIYFPQIGVIVEPTHDFEFLFFTKEVSEYKRQLLKMLEKHKNLSLYEESKWDWD
jgi:hypothetical protein